MTRSLPNLNWTPDQIALAERLGRESREHIADRMRLGTPFLTAVKIEADYIAEAWADLEDKVQLRAIRIAFDVLRHLNPNARS